MKFYLGTHEVSWLRKVDVPLFVSHTRLARRRTLPRAVTSWACDSGAFSEVAGHGEFTTTPTAYAATVRRYRDEIGMLDWAAPQDHMCEPWVLAKSRLASTVAEAQAWTVDNYLTLRTIAADLPFVPVLQGQTLDDYRRHADAYAAAGVDLAAEHTVGVGSVCRRQATTEIAELVAALSADGLRLHGFGVKGDGLRLYGWCLTSADSMSWSFRGRNVHPCPRAPHRRQSCANCLHFALEWRERAIATTGHRPVQLTLGGAS